MPRKPITWGLKDFSTEGNLQGSRSDMTSSKMSYWTETQLADLMEWDKHLEWFLKVNLVRRPRAMASEAITKDINVRIGSGKVVVVMGNGANVMANRLDSRQG